MDQGGQNILTNAYSGYRYEDLILRNLDIKMLLNNLSRTMFKPFRFHRLLLGCCFGRVLEDYHRF